MKHREKHHALTRRSTLIGFGCITSSLVFPTSVGWAAKRILTPPQTSGPFYPESWAGDSDNDLVIVKGEAAQAMGKVLHLNGRVMDRTGQPVSDANVEIWQCDAKGIYHHSRDIGGNRRPDGKFQGRGRTITNRMGEYSFRTIKPVPYPGRTPHIHFRILAKGQRPLTTQMYVAGEELNNSDFILNAVRDKAAREQLIAHLEPADQIEPGALRGSFDIFMG